MTTASQTMITRTVGHHDERSGLAMIVVGALGLVLAVGFLYPLAERVLGTTHEIQ
jgi:hypothetical protein